MLRRRVGILLLSLLSAAVLSVGAFFCIQRSSLPDLHGRVNVPSLQEPVTITFDRFAVPTIDAASRLDAFRALGFVTAQQRLFQMDLIRRKSSGRLAEIIGETALDIDIRQRHLGLTSAAAQILETLPQVQKSLLQAYADGINQAIDEADVLPLEFMILGYRPEPWNVQDSLLVALSMFQLLSASEKEERMLSVMETTLPPDVLAFLTPDTDEYSAPLDGKGETRRPPMPIPVASIAALQVESEDNRTSGVVDTVPSVIGSNNWAVNRSKTADGRAILANDMHLPLSVPNIWYRANMRFAGSTLIGFTLPGVPLLIAGSNGRVAWGFTSAHADDLDLVVLELDPGQPHRYRTPEGWRPFTTARETIPVKDGKAVVVERKMTLWGPVAQRSLLTRPVAIHWTALSPRAVDLSFMDMERASTVREAVSVLNRSGLPIMNAMLADSNGSIAWTLTGKIPQRRELDGSVSRPWADGRVGWSGYIKPDALPHIVDPSVGFLATANNRTVSTSFPYPIGHNYASGFRFHRIKEGLKMRDNLTEQDMLRLQLDTASNFYRFYQSLALSVINEQAMARNPELASVRRYVSEWDGKAEIESRGVGLLMLYRHNLASAVFSSFLAVCREQDERFHYRWFKMDVPLQQILIEKPLQILPNPDEYGDWDALILAVLERSVHQIKQRYSVQRLQALHWGRISTTEIRHPFTHAFPLLGYLLNMPQEPLAGCSHCIRVTHRQHGVSERLVVAPGHPEDGILHMPGGQSGHPLSDHYADQHRFWLEGLPIRLLSNEIEHTLILTP